MAVRPGHVAAVALCKLGLYLCTTARASEGFTLCFLFTLFFSPMLPHQQWRRLMIIMLYSYFSLYTCADGSVRQTSRPPSSLAPQ